MRLGLVLTAALAAVAGCASAPQTGAQKIPQKIPKRIYVINDTGQVLSGGISGATRFRLMPDLGAQAVGGFPDHRWWLIADGCTYHYPAIATDDPAWTAQQAEADAAGASDLLVRVAKNFTVRAYTYRRDADSMMSREVKVGGLPMKPMKACEGESGSAR